MDVYLVGLPMAQPTVGRGRSGHRMHTTASRFNVGLLVWAGRRGGGGLVPAGSEGVAAAPETRRTPSHELQPWAAAEGERGQTDCDERRFSHRPRDKTIPRLLCRA